MAFVAGDIFVNLTFMDKARNISTRQLQLNVADMAAAVAAAATVVAAYTAVTDAEILGYTISRRYGEDSVVVPTDAEVENTALLTLQLDADPMKSASLSIPAPKESIFLASSGVNNNYVDLVDAGVQGVLALFHPATGVAYISDGETSSSLKNGRRVHRRSSRNRTQRIG